MKILTLVLTFLISISSFADSQADKSSKKMPFKMFIGDYSIESCDIQGTESKLSAAVCDGNVGEFKVINQDSNLIARFSATRVVNGEYEDYSYIQPVHLATSEESKCSFNSLADGNVTSICNSDKTNSVAQMTEISPDKVKVLFLLHREGVLEEGFELIMKKR